MSEHDDESHDAKKEREKNLKIRSAPIVGGGTPKNQARCPGCGVVAGRPHQEGCAYA